MIDFYEFAISHMTTSPSLVKLIRFTEEYFSDKSEETSESDEVTDSEDEDQLARRQAKKELKAAAAAAKGPKVPAEVAPFVPRKRTRLLMTTRAHEYDKMYSIWSCVCVYPETFLNTVCSFLSRHLYQTDQISGAKEVLVPISVEIDIDATYKFQDSFSWNINGMVIFGLTCIHESLTIFVVLQSQA